MSRTTYPNRRVPDDESPATCPYCDRPFPDEDIRTLHLGLAHYEDLSEAEQESFHEAYDREAADLRSFQIRALAALVAIYFGFLFVYAGIT